MMTSLRNPTVPAGYIRVCVLEQIPLRGRKTVYVGDTRVLIVSCGDDLHAIEDRSPQTGRSIAHGEVLDCVFTTPTVGARPRPDPPGAHLGPHLWPIQTRRPPLDLSILAGN